MLTPVGFQRDIMRRKLYAKQVEILDAIRTHNSVSIAGCHGSGKTFCIAGEVPYELIANDEMLVLTIAPTMRQVKSMWAEIEAAIQSVPSRLPERTTTGWQLTAKCKAIGFSSSKGVNAQGFHGKRVLLLIDEAIGISGELWDAIEGIRMAGDVRIVKACNPTVPSGPVYEDFTRMRGTHGHKAITISAFDTPNLIGTTMEQLLQMSDEELDYAPFPNLARRRAVVELYHKWGPTNPRFLSRVLGQFPTQADDAVFALAWIEAAGKPYEREELKPHLRPGLFIQVGIDVAGPGDDETSATARIGPYIVAADAWPDADPRIKCLEWLSKLQQRFPQAALILVGDTVGIGWYFMRYLADLKFDVRGFVAQASPIDRVMFHNAKAEGYFTLREWMKAGQIHGVEDEDTKAQLSDIRYRERQGRIEIESKQEARARGSRSPDRAESLVMAYAPLQAAGQQRMVLNPAGAYQISQV